MRKFDTTIEDIFGTTGLFNINIDENNGTGNISWPSVQANIKNLETNTKKTSISFTVISEKKQLDSYVTVSKVDSDNSIIIYMKNHNIHFNYYISDVGYLEFLTFVKSLKV
jgi:hypothetical protein